MRGIAKGAVRRRILPFALSLLVAFLSTGCWDRRELDTFSIVLGLGLDQNEQTGMLDITAQVVQTTPESAKTQKSGDEASFSNIHGSGPSLFAALRASTHSTSRRLYVAHNQVVVIGRALAEKGVRDVLDLLARDQESRLTILLAIADERASKVFDVKPAIEQMTAMDIVNLIQMEKLNGEVISVRLFDFFDSIVKKGASSVAPIISVNPVTGHLDTTGTAVFFDDRLVGELDLSQTRGLLFAVDKIRSTILVADCEGTSISFEVADASSVISPAMENGKPCIHLHVQVKAKLGAQTGWQNFTSPDKLETLRATLVESVRGDILNAVGKAQELDADIFCFGDSFYKTLPAEWAKLAQQWPAIFKELPVDVDVKVDLIGFGGLEKPVIAEEG